MAFQDGPETVLREDRISQAGGLQEPRRISAAESARSWWPPGRGLLLAWLASWLAGLLLLLLLLLLLPAAAGLLALLLLLLLAVSGGE